MIYSHPNLPNFDNNIDGPVIGTIGAVGTTRAVGITGAVGSTGAVYLFSLLLLRSPPFFVIDGNINVRTSRFRLI